MLQRAVRQRADFPFVAAVHESFINLGGQLSLKQTGALSALAKLFFGKDLDGLGESLKYVAQADWYSLLKGRFWQDWDATLKFNLFAFLCIAWPVALAEMVVRTLY